MPRNDDPFDNYDDDEDDGFLTFDAREEEGASRGPIILGAIVLLLVVFGAIAWAYFVGNKGTGDDTPQIAAQTDTFKEAPMDPGGLGTEDLDKGVYDSVDGAAPPPLSVEPAGTSTGSEDPLVAANVIAPPPVQPAPVVKTAPPPRPAVVAQAKPKPAPVQAKPKPVVKVATPAPTKAATVVAKTEPKSQPVPVATSAAPKAAAPSPSSGSFSAQLGSYASRAAADTAASRFRQQTSGNVAISSADLGAKGTWYRVRVTGLDSRDAAVAFCAQVKASGGNCIPSR